MSVYVCHFACLCYCFDLSPSPHMRPHSSSMHALWPVSLVDYYPSSLFNPSNLGDVAFTIYSCLGPYKAATAKTDLEEKEPDCPVWLQRANGRNQTKGGMKKEGGKEEGGRGRWKENDEGQDYQHHQHQQLNKHTMSPFLPPPPPLSCFLFFAFRCRGCGGRLSACGNAVPLSPLANGSSTALPGSVDTPCAVDRRSRS